jgi:16S rRNA (uracil1498-N3)-methyltransferase
MSEHRFLFYLPDFTADDTTLHIDGDEHHHLSRVLRLTPGTEIYLTNGTGSIARARLIDTSSTQATAEIEEITEHQRVGPAVGLPLIKKDRFELALEQCVELGITECIPFVAERCHLRAFSATYMERLERIAVSAMKQSFQAWRPALQSPVSFEALLGHLGSYDRVVVGDPDGDPAGPGPGSTLVVVGPEAGLTGAEVGSLRTAGAVPVSAGRHRLRAGTAAAVLVAAVSGSD